MSQGCTNELFTLRRQVPWFWGWSAPHFWCFRNPRRLKHQLTWRNLPLFIGGFRIFQLVSRMSFIKKISPHIALYCNWTTYQYIVDTGYIGCYWSPPTWVPLVFSVARLSSLELICHSRMFEPRKKSPNSYGWSTNPAQYTPPRNKALIMAY